MASDIIGVCLVRSLHIRRNTSFCKQQSKEYIRKLYFYSIYKATSDGKVMESLNFSGNLEVELRLQAGKL